MYIWTLRVRHHSDTSDELGAVSVYPTFEDAARTLREIAVEEVEQSQWGADMDAPGELDLGDVFELLSRLGVEASIDQHVVPAPLD